MYSALSALVTLRYNLKSIKPVLYLEYFKQIIQPWSFLFKFEPTWRRVWKNSRNRLRVQSTPSRFCKRQGIPSWYVMFRIVHPRSIHLRTLKLHCYFSVTFQGLFKHLITCKVRSLEGLSITSNNFNFRSIEIFLLLFSKRLGLFNSNALLILDRIYNRCSFCLCKWIFHW